MLALDSPVWNELECARGPAGHIPALIERLCDPSLDDEATRAVWREVWDDLCHQNNVYASTYAAVPHLAASALNGKIVSQVELLLFSGQVLAFGQLVGKPLSVKLVEGFSQVVDKIAGKGEAIVHEAKAQNLVGHYPCTRLVQSSLALTFGCDPVVRLIQSVIDDELQVEVACPGCDTAREVEFDKLEASDESDPDPDGDDDPVFAGVMLASDLGDADLKRRIASLRSSVKCDNCNVEFALYDGYV